MIEIHNYRPGKQHDFDKSLATFDIVRGDSTYIDLRLMQNKHGHYFLLFPSKKRKDFLGKDIFLRLYDWGKKRNDEFSKEVLDELKNLGYVPKGT